MLNDEAHHLFSPQDAALKKWLKFLLNPDYGFRCIVNVTGTPYVGNDYFPDVVYRYGLKQAIAEHVVKKPNYKLEDTYVAHDWQKTYAIHRKNWADYGSRLKPITIVVTQEIARCVEVWRELIDFLVEKEGISRADAERKCIWVTSGIPSGVRDKARVEAACPRRDDRDSPEKRRTENLALLAEVDQPGSPVEWIVSVSMLTEGWDVKNVFQIVPHESRAFNSKLLIAQVLGRGLRVPPGFDDQPLVTINNHEAWSGEIANLLKDILEVENTLSWGYEPSRAQYAFPLHNLRYQPEQTTVEIKTQAGARTAGHLPAAGTHYHRVQHLLGDGRARCGDQPSRPIRHRSRGGRHAALHPREGRGAGAGLDEGAAASVHHRRAGGRRLRHHLPEQREPAAAPTGVRPHVP